MRLRVLSLNVWNEQGDPRRPELINRELRRLTPDLVALQEVVHCETRSQLHDLLDGTGLHSTHQAQVLASQSPWADRYGGSVVASRWPHRIVEVLDQRLVDATDTPWCTLAAIVSLPIEGDVLFIASTGAWRANAEAARERQVMALTDLDARHRQALPTIMAGDFNASPDAASIRYLTGLQSLGGRSVHYHDAWSVAGQGLGHTWTIDNPNGKFEIDKIVRQPDVRKRIDYVFIGSWDAHPKAYAHVRTAALAFDQPIDGVWASDHFGVVADLDIGRSSQQSQEQS
jgi:endonuclease/exonuclease/phosphatase family metal-dependent hydrolase